MIKMKCMRGNGSREREGVKRLKGKKKALRRQRKRERKKTRMGEIKTEERG